MAFFQDGGGLEHQMQNHVVHAFRDVQRVTMKREINRLQQLDGTAESEHCGFRHRFRQHRANVERGRDPVGEGLRVR